MLAIGLAAVGLAACANQGVRSRRASPSSTAPAQPANASEYVVTPQSKYLHLKGSPLGLALTRRLLGYPRIPRSILKEHALMFAYYYGQLASAADTRKAGAAIRLYYKTAAKGDARRACSMIVPSVAKALPIDYGRDGDAYLRGAKTCQAVLGRMFRHSHSLADSLIVRGLLTHGAQGYAFIDSNKMPVSLIELQRSSNGWAIDSPLASPVSIAAAIGG
jgi:hypothetical protein